MPYIYSTWALCTDEKLPKDDIDELFEKLQPVEPPKSVIDRILKTVTTLPLPQQTQPQPKAALPWRHLDTLVVRNDEREPS